MQIGYGLVVISVGDELGQLFT